MLHKTSNVEGKINIKFPLNKRFFKIKVIYYVVYFSIVSIALSFYSFSLSFFFQCRPVAVGVCENSKEERIGVLKKMFREVKYRLLNFVLYIFMK